MPERTLLMLRYFKDRAAIAKSLNERFTQLDETLGLSAELEELNQNQIAGKAKFVKHLSPENGLWLREPEFKLLWDENPNPYSPSYREIRIYLDRNGNICVRGGEDKETHLNPKNPQFQEEFTEALRVAYENSLIETLTVP